MSESAPNGNGRTNGSSIDNLPQWARVTLLVGLPTVLVFIAIGLGTGAINSPLNALPAIREGLIAHEARSATNDYEQTRLLRQICRNIAKSEVSAAACER